LNKETALQTDLPYIIDELSIIISMKYYLFQIRCIKLDTFQNDCVQLSQLTSLKGSLISSRSILLS